MSPKPALLRGLTVEPDEGAATQRSPKPSGTRRATPGTHADRLRMQLADEIVRGELAPGITLDETELARRFAVSRTPVREAIRQLAASGLVVARPHRSAVVARPSKQQVLGMFEALRELEALCAGLAAERMPHVERADLVQINARLDKIARQSDPQRYHDGNEAFHAAIWVGARNDYLAEITRATRARIAPFSRAQFHMVGRLAQSHGEHEHIIAAILAADRAAAEAAMRAHIITVHDAYAVYQRET